jgi:hypothetical protein
MCRFSNVSSPQVELGTKTYQPIYIRKFQTFRMTPPNMKFLSFSIISPCFCTFLGPDPLTHVTPFSNPHFRRAALCRQLWELEQLVAPGAEAKI